MIKVRITFSDVEPVEMTLNLNRITEVTHDVVYAVVPPLYLTDFTEIVKVEEIKNTER